LSEARFVLGRAFFYVGIEVMQVDDGREFKVSRAMGKAGVVTGCGVLCGLAGSPGMVVAYV
jgi:hypothetical protein